MKWLGGYVSSCRTGASPFLFFTIIVSTSELLVHHDLMTASSSKSPRGPRVDSQYGLSGAIKNSFGLAKAIAGIPEGQSNLFAHNDTSLSVDLASNAIGTTAAIAKEVAEMLTSVPYVKSVAGIVLQILKIRDVSASVLCIIFLAVLRSGIGD